MANYLIRLTCRSAAVAILLAVCSGELPVAVAAPPQSSSNPGIMFGTIAGIISDARGAPLAHAMVVAVNPATGSIRSTLSGSDGVFSFADLPPGRWSLRVQDGADVRSELTVNVTANNATRADLSTPTTAGLAAGPIPGASPGPGAAPSRPPAVQPTQIAEALQAPEPAPQVDHYTPLANVTDIGWMNGTSRATTPVFDTKFFTPEVRFDVNYLYDFNNPHDHTIVGSTEEFRSGEFQIEQVSLGGNFHWHNVQARFLSMFGLFAVTTPRNDASLGVGQWDLQGAYKYMSEANAGYHWDNVGHGLNVDAGIFVSYLGLFSYYNFDNWTYQPSFVSSNTPWFFNGLRVQYWPTQNLKIEPWLINGWQSYAKFNHDPGVGGQILWIPNENFKLVLNSYFLGEDNLAFGSGQPANAGNPDAPAGQLNPAAPFISYAHVHRIHEDDSVLWRFYQGPADEKGAGISKMALSLTWDVGCEYGGGVNCWRGPNKANFFGVMLYDRTWWNHDRFALTLGGGFMNNPGRYLALLPPINGASAASGTPYFTENPGQKLFQWDTQLNLQYMPKDWITWWTELTFRHSDVPYWAGRGGVTPPLGNTGQPAIQVCNNGASMGTDGCVSEGGIWYPDLRRREVIWGAGVMVRF